MSKAQPAGRYYVITRTHDDDHCYLDGAPDDMDYSYRLARGVSAKAVYDPAKPMRMDNEFKGKMIPDVVSGASGMCIVSARIADLVREITLPTVECFPITILDHKKKKVSTPTWVINPIGWVDCLDRNRTIGSALPDLQMAEARAAGCKLPALETNGDDVPHREYTKFKAIVLRQDRIVPELPLFRVRSSPQTIILRHDLTERMLKLKPSGCIFEPVEVTPAGKV